MKWVISLTTGQPTGLPIPLLLPLAPPSRHWMGDEEGEGEEDEARDAVLGDPHTAGTDIKNIRYKTSAWRQKDLTGYCFKV